MLIQTIVPYCAALFLAISDVYQQYHGTDRINLTKCLYNEFEEKNLVAQFSNPGSSAVQNHFAKM